MRALIHRSSALRASTDAYGADILRMPACCLSRYVCAERPTCPTRLIGDSALGWCLHPGRGARYLARASRRGVSPDEDPGIARREKIPTTPAGCRTKRAVFQCDTLPGSYL